MGDSELRKKLLNGKKDERINFAVTPELKDAASKLAEERCMSLSSLIAAMLADEVVANKAILEEGE